MNKYSVQLKFKCGTDFDEASKIAKDKSIEIDCVVEFIFNGIKCLVDKKTNLQKLHNYYSTTSMKKIGPNFEI